jgi:transposase
MNKITEKTLIATADFGKTNHYGYCTMQNGKDIKSFQFKNNLEGFNKFYDKIKKEKENNGANKILFGFESTGSYGEPMVHYLKQKGVILRQVNPMHTKRVKTLSDNSPGKNDNKDPRVIADILRLGRSLTVIIAEGIIADLRHYVHSRERKKEDINRIKNRIEAIIARMFPEFLVVMKGLRSKSALYIIKHYPRPEDIKKLGLKQLADLLRKISRCQLGEAKAKSLYQAAIESVGIREGITAMTEEIRMNIEQMELAETQLNNIEERIKAILKDIPVAEIIMSIKGMGPILTAGLIAEIVDFKTYTRMKEVEKLAGLNLYEKSSGKHKGKKKISKMGKAFLRNILYFASLNLVRKGGVFHEKYQKHLSKGMSKTKALVAIMRQLLKLVYAMARDHKKYDHNYRKGKVDLLTAA